MNGKCSKCGRSVSEPGVILVRVNPKGETGIVDCEPCAGMLADVVVQQIDDALNDPASEGLEP